MRKSTGLQLLVGVVGLVALALSGPGYANGKSYLMVCKGGGPMRLKLWNGSRATMTVRFSPARVSATSKEPGYGECAWTDRPVGANEPRELLLLASNPIVELTITDRRVTITRTSASNGAASTAYLLNAIQRRQKFYVHVRSDRGYLKVTGVGP